MSRGRVHPALFQANRNHHAPQGIPTRTAKEVVNPVPTPTTLEIEFGGRQLILETGKLAGLAGGAVTLRYGDSMVLGTANRSEPRPGLDFFPLTVEFEERM